MISLADWQGKHAAKLYCPGSLASVSALNRILAPIPEHHAFRWTKAKRNLAIRLHDDPDITDETIAGIIRCSSEDVRRMLQENNVEQAAEPGRRKESLIQRIRVNQFSRANQTGRQNQILREPE
jgi:hypothetical protein